MGAPTGRRRYNYPQPIPGSSGGGGGGGGGSTPFALLREVNFASVPDQDLLGDGAKVIDGLTFTVVNSALLSELDVGPTSGGLRFNWPLGVAQRFFGSTRNAPYVFIYLSEFFGGEILRGKEVRIEVDATYDSPTSDETVWPMYLGSQNFAATREVGVHVGEFAGKFNSGYPAGSLFRQNGFVASALSPDPQRFRVEVLKDSVEGSFGDGSGGWITNSRGSRYSFGIYQGLTNQPTAPALYFAQDRVNTSGSSEILNIQSVRVYTRDSESESSIWLNQP